MKVKATASLFVLILLASQLNAQPAPTPSGLTIDDAVKTALSNNPTVRAAADQAEASRAALRASRASQSPTVDVAANYQHVSSPTTVQIPSQTPGGTPNTINVGAPDTLTGTLSANQPIYTGGRISGQISQAEAQLNVDLGRLGTTQEDTALNTRQAYFNVLLNQATVISTQQNLTAAQQQLDVTNTRFEVGTAPKFDVLTAQTQVSQAQQAFTRAQNGVELAFVALDRLIGVPQDRRYTLVDPGQSPFPAEDMPTLVATAKQNRPEILSARSQVAAAKAGIKIAQSQTLPQLNLTASYTKSNGSVFAQNGFVVGANASLEIFNGGRTRANVQQAKSLTAESSENLENVTQGAEQDVRNAYLNLQTARQNIDTARTGLAQAQEAYDIAVIRYESGVGTSLEESNALAALATARTSLDQAIYNYNTAYATLQRALGKTTY